MAKSRSPNREKAFEIYKECHGKVTSKEIAKRLGENVKNIQYWRSVDNWKDNYKPQGGAPYGNQNALGNKGGAPPEGNQNARTYGWFSKYFPIETRNLIKEAEEANGSPLDILWAQIQTQWVAIIRAQKIMFVEDKNEMIKELKKEKYEVVELKGEVKQVPTEIEYEFQFAWDRQATFLNAQSRAMAQLTNMIKKYDDMLHNDWDIASEEQKLRVDRLRQQIDEQNKEHKKNLDQEKLQLQKDRFEHQKDIDSKKYW